MRESRGLDGYWSHLTSNNSPLPVDAIVMPLVASQQNQVWMSVWISRGIGVPAEQYGLFLSDGTNWSEYKLGEHGLPIDTITFLAADNHNRLWLSMPHTGICCFDGQSTMVYKEQSEFPAHATLVTGLRVDRLDRVWAATLGQGVYRLSNNSWDKVADICDRAAALSVDRNNNLWVACVDATATRFLSRRAGSWELVCSCPLGLRHADEVACFVVDGSGNVWVGRRLGGLMVWNGKAWHRYTKRDCPLLYSNIDSLTIDESDNLWVGIGGGSFAVFDGSKWHSWQMVNPESTQSPIQTDAFQEKAGYIHLGSCMAVDGAGRKWLSAATGIVMFTPQG